MANGAKERRIGYSYTKYEGIDYSLVYNKDYYLNKYPDIKRAYGDNPIELLKHFIRSGMNEGRQGIANFSMQYYRDKYIDLKRAFGNNNKAYYMHFINAGKREGRRGCSENSYNGVDYSLVYDMNYYYNNNPDEEKDPNSVNIAEIIVGKNRHGSTTTVKVAWNPEFTMFSTLERIKDDQ